MGSQIEIFNRDRSKVAAGERMRARTDLQDWVGGVEAEGWEEIVGLGGYGKTLTIISCSAYPDEEETEEEERLERWWTPRFRR